MTEPADKEKANAPPPGEEEKFFAGAGPPPTSAEIDKFAKEFAKQPKKRTLAVLFARNPVFAVAVVAVCSWLIVDMWPDVVYYMSPTTAVDLGGPEKYHLDRAVPNRLTRISGAPVATVNAIDARTKEERRIVGLLGTNLAVDRPGGAAPAVVFEGRLLPLDKSLDYGPFVELLRKDGWGAQESWLVLRDNERPRERWGKPALTMVLLLVGLINLRALLASLWR